MSDYSLPIIDAIKHDYEKLRFMTYEYDHKGLYRKDNNFFAVVDQVKNNPELKKKLREIFENYSTLSIPHAEVVGEVPIDAEKVILRNKVEKCCSFYQPLTIDLFLNQLIRHIPKEYHPFHADMKWYNNKFTLTFKRNLTQEEQDEIKLICESLGYQGYDYEFITNPNIPDYPGEVTIKPNTHNNLALVASGLIQKQFSRVLLDKYEEDEDFWSQNRHSIFLGAPPTKEYYLPNQFYSKGKSSCFVDASVFQRQNLRVYLSLYETVIIALPFQQQYDFYSIFQVTKVELRELIIRKRLLFVVPQNLDRYDKKLIDDILSTDPNCIIFSRKLATSTLAGIQNSSGVLGKSFSSDEQYEFLKLCNNSSSEGLKVFAKSLSEQWSFFEHLIDCDGATSVYQSGISRFVSNVFRNRGKDLLIELTSAASSFEFAKGLNAHHFPFDSNQYSEVEACRCISSFYNGFSSQSLSLKEAELSLLLEEVLSINNDMNILELDDALSSLNIRSLPKVISQYANLEPEERSFKLYQLNKELRQIEKNRSKLSSLDFSGFFLPAVTGAAMESAGISGSGYVSLAAWIVNAINLYAKQNQTIDNSILEYLSAKNHRVSRDTIIVSKCRNAIKR